MSGRQPIAALLLAGALAGPAAVVPLAAGAGQPAREPVAGVAEPDGSAPDIALARRTLDSVLSDRRFARARGLSWQEAVRRRLRDWFLRLFSTLEPVFGRRDLARILAWTAAIGAVLVLLVWLARVTFRRRGERPIGVELAGQPVLPGHVLAQEAAELIRAGRFRDGARLAYAAALRRLEEEGALRRDPAQTPREHLRALPPSHRRAAAMAAMTAAFERIWYGARPGSSRRWRPAAGTAAGSGMPAFRSRELSIATAGLALVIALSVATAILSPPSAENLPPGSSYSYEPEGTAAAYQTLTRLGYTVRRSFDPVSALAVDPAATTLIVAEPGDAPTNSDRRAVQAMATAGARVLLTGCGGAAFLAGAGIAPSGAEETSREFSARTASPLSLHAARITMRADCGSWTSGPYPTVYGDGRTAAVRAAASGTGMLVWWAGTTPATNAGIQDAGSLELLLNVVGDRHRTVLWDEFYHGQRRSLYSYAKQTPLPWAAAQLALVMLVAGAIYARRRAPVIDRLVEPRVSPLEFVDTMAGLYARANTAADAVSTARQRLRRLLAERTGVAADTDDRRLAAAAAARLHVDAAELAAALEAGASVTDERTPAREALPIVRRLQACAAAIAPKGD